MAGQNSSLRRAADDSQSHGEVRFPLNVALSSPWAFLRPTSELHHTTVGSAKHFLDSLAISVTDSQTVRQQNIKKRKRSETESDPSKQTLQLKQLYVDGFTPDQIWEQAIRILDCAGQEVEHDYQAQNAEQFSSKALPSARYVSSELDIEGAEHGDSPEEFTDSSSVNDYDDSDMESDLETGDAAIDESEAESEIDGTNSEDAGPEESDDESGRDTYMQDPFGLNDGFFSIDDFNKQSEQLERQDAKGGPDEDLESEDEEIDWHLDPLVAGNAKSFAERSAANNQDHTGEDVDMSGSDEEGPTFGNADLQGQSDSEDDGAPHAGIGDGWINTSDIKYSDFFAPPPRKVTSKKTRPLPKTQPDGASLQNDMERAMADVRRDLFDDEASDEDDDAPNDDIDGNKTGRSTHEKQRARIADEIRRLEAANVAKKEWMLAGEARAVERPVNSLIEEDLDFERIGKPVPVVTTETSEDIEDLVKRRILAKEFDEVIRRRPGVPENNDRKRARFELDDNKAQQSLAEQYEADHLRATDPNYVDPKNQKLIREHTEITNLWKEISSQLDTLSNWHYKPKAPQANINVVTDVATITMEDARPMANGAMSGSAALAPQEIYKPGEDGKAAGELVLKNGASVSKEEMTREDKAKLRRQRKKTQSKSNAGNTQSSTGKSADKQQVVSDLKKGGVKVIGKQGEITDINGKASGPGAKNGADTLKL